MLVRSMYEMNAAAQQRKTTECHDFQATRLAVAEAGAAPAGEPAGTVRSDMTPAGLGWYNPARLDDDRVENMATPG
jgi:hypothetical protein